MAQQHIMIQALAAPALAGRSLRHHPLRPWHLPCPCKARWSAMPPFCFCFPWWPYLLVLAARDRSIWHRDTAFMNPLRFQPVTHLSSLCPVAWPCFRQGCFWTASFTRFFFSTAGSTRCSPFDFAQVPTLAAGSCLLLLRAMACTLM